MLVWAHRGASAYAPENTMEAFELAVRQGADGIELDVQITRDRHLVVMHDETVDRTTNGSGWLQAHTLAELRALDASAGLSGFVGARVPLLAEVFELVRDAGITVNVELKNTEVPYPGLEEKVLALVAEFGLAEQVLISSFNHESLHAMRQAGVGIDLGLLASDVMVEPWAYASALGMQAFHPADYAVREAEVVAASHRSGLRAHVWTVDDPARAAELAGWGVDAIFTNRPDVARRALAGGV